MTMGVFVIASIVASVSCTAQPSQAMLQKFQSTQKHMGVNFEILLYAPDKSTANRGFEAAFSRIAALNRIMSDYDPQSELSQLSHTAGQGRYVVVSRDLWRVLKTSQKLSRQTEGAFDITVGPLTKLWRRARRKKELPPEDRFSGAREAVGYQYLQLDKCTKKVRLSQPHMRLDLGGIAKGYAADEALKALKKIGIHRALVDAGGDLAIGAPPPDASAWKIGIAPLKTSAPPSQFLMLSCCAIATSGDAWQYVEIDGKRYSHILDPRTGMGLSNRSSVTIVAPNCMLADSLASAVSVLGSRKGLQLVEKTCGTEALILQVVDGKLQTFASKCFDMLPKVK